jgi:hypothetical protein
MSEPILCHPDTVRIARSWQTEREENPRIYAQLSFLAYYSNCPCLDTEWLLSTLFDASLLSTLKPPETAALFLGLRLRLGHPRSVNRVGNHKYFFNFTPLDSDARTRNDLFIIRQPIRADFEIIRVRR